MRSSHRNASILILTCSILKILAVKSDQSSKMKAVEFFNTFPMSLDSFFSNECAESYEFLKIAISFICQNHWFSAESVQGCFKEPKEPNMSRVINQKL
jgi:hypothetical protein